MNLNLRHLDLFSINNELLNKGIYCLINNYKYTLNEYNVELDSPYIESLNDETINFKWYRRDRRCFMIWNIAYGDLGVIIDYNGNDEEENKISGIISYQVTDGNLAYWMSQNLRK